MLEFELDFIQRELDEGSSVVFAWCKGGGGYCPANNPGPKQVFQKSKCITCKSRVRAGLDWLRAGSGSITEIEFRNLSPKQELRTKEVMNFVKEQELDNAALEGRFSPREKVCWQSALSGLCSDLRDSNPDLSLHNSRFLFMFEQALVSEASMENHIERYKPDEVYIFNGRMPRYWPALEVAQNSGIRSRIYEYPSKGFEDYLLLEEVTPHDRETYARIGEARLTDLGQAERAALLNKASIWFEERKLGKLEGKQAQLLGDLSTAVNRGSVPKRWMESRNRIAIFPSSQYEFANLPSHEGHLSLHQAQTIERLLKRFPSYAFCIRLHPSQPETDRDFLTGIDRLDTYQNCYIERGQSGADSYKLAAEAAISITFGSTIGVELAKLGLDVVECGPPFYSVVGAVESAVEISDLYSYVEEHIQAGGEVGLTVQQRTQGAERAIAAQFASGTRPVYLRKSSYFEAEMLRNQDTTSIGPRKLASSLSSVLRFFENPRSAWNKATSNVYRLKNRAVLRPIAKRGRQ